MSKMFLFFSRTRSVAAWAFGGGKCAETLATFVRRKASSILVINSTEAVCHNTSAQLSHKSRRLRKHIWGLLINVRAPQCCSAFTLCSQKTRIRIWLVSLHLRGILGSEHNNKQALNQNWKHVQTTRRHVLCNNAAKSRYRYQCLYNWIQTSDHSSWNKEAALVKKSLKWMEINQCLSYN